MTTQDAAEIAASIDLATTAGWNLRALLLRLLDGDGWRVPGREHAVGGGVLDMLTECVHAGLVDYPNLHSTPGLTPLGREVAERLRPVPWRVDGFIGDGDEEWAVSCGDLPRALCRDGADAERIAALLTRDDLEAAKRYRTEAAP
jgi:hypothetical protein